MVRSSSIHATAPRDENLDIHVVDARGGVPRQLTQALVFATGAHDTGGAPRLLHVGETGIYLSYRDASRVPRLGFYDLENDELMEIASSGRLRPSLGIDVSIDERWVAYASVDSETDDLMLVEGFR